MAYKDMLSLRLRTFLPNWGMHWYEKSTTFYVITIIVAGVLVRIALAGLFDFHGDLRGGDSGYYLTVASNIVQYGMHGIGDPPVPNYFRAPLYSFFSAGILKLFGESSISFFIAQSSLTISAAVLVFLLLRVDNFKVAVLAAFMVAMSPFDAILNMRVLSETLVAFLLLLAILLLHRAGSIIDYFFAGLLLALAALTRDIYIFLPFFMIGYLGLRRLASAKLLIFFLFGFALGIFPWIAGIRFRIKEELL